MYTDTLAAFEGSLIHFHLSLTFDNDKTLYDDLVTGRENGLRIRNK